MKTENNRVEELFTYLNRIIEQFARLKCDCLNCQCVNEIEDLSLQELNAISFIGREGPCIMRSIAEHMQLAVSTITTIVDKLVNKGLVIRERSEEDRRIVKVSLTEQGEMVYKADLDIHLELSQAMLSTLNEDEQEILIVLLRKISRKLNI